MTNAAILGFGCSPRQHSTRTSARWRCRLVQVRRSLRASQEGYRRFRSSNSSAVRGQSSRNSRDKARSASSLPLVWQPGQ